MLAAVEFIKTLLGHAWEAGGHCIGVIYVHSLQLYCQSRWLILPFFSKDSDGQRSKSAEIMTNSKSVISVNSCVPAQNLDFSFWTDFWVRLMLLQRTLQTMPTLHKLLRRQPHKIFPVPRMDEFQKQLASI